MNLSVNFKKVHKDAVTPTYATDGSGALDLTAVDKRKVYSSNHGNLEFIEYSLGLAFEIPEDHVGLVFPRSSISKQSLDLCNAVGVIDADFRGEITCRFRHLGPSGFGEYNVGDRVAQLLIIPIPKVRLYEVDTLSETERGEGGYGSTNLIKSQAW